MNHVNKVDGRLALGQKAGLIVEHVSTNCRYQPTPLPNYNNTSISGSVNIPNVNTVVDRVAYIAVPFEVTFTGTDQGLPLLALGAYDGPRQLPFHHCLTSSTVNLGNQTFSENPNIYIHELMKSLRWEDYKDTMSSGLCMPDYFQAYSDSATFGNENNPLMYQNAYQDTRGGFPITVVSNTNTSATVRFTSIEPLLVNPFSPPSAHQSKGFIGLTQVNVNFQLANLSQIWSHDSNGRVFASVAASIYDTPQILMKYYSQNIMERLPEKVYYNSENRVFQNTNDQTTASGASSTLVLNSVQINAIPDAIMIYVKRRQADQTYLTSDAYARIDSINLTFGNRSGLLNDATSQQLFSISKKNGLNMTYNQWAKYSGSVLILKPSDFGLDASLAPGSMQNTQLQVTVNYTNLSGASISYNAYIVLITGQVMTYDVRSNMFTVQEGVISYRTVLDRKLLTPENYMDDNLISDDQLLQGGGFFGKLGRIFKVLKPIGEAALKVARPFVQDIPVIGHAADVALRAVGRGKKSRSRRAGVLLGGSKPYESDEDNEQPDNLDYIQ